jgi:hypothetical protein
MTLLFLKKPDCFEFREQCGDRDGEMQKAKRRATDTARPDATARLGRVATSRPPPDLLLSPLLLLLLSTHNIYHGTTLDCLSYSTVLWAKF